MVAKDKSTYFLLYSHADFELTNMQTTKELKFSLSLELSCLKNRLCTTDFVKRDSKYDYDMAYDKSG